MSREVRRAGLENVVDRGIFDSWLLDASRMPAVMGVDRTENCFSHAQRWKNAGDLKSAADSTAHDSWSGKSGNVLAIKEDAPAIRPQCSANEIEEAGFAGAVGADDGRQRSRRKMQADLAYRADAAKRFLQILDLEHVSGGPASPDFFQAPARRARISAMPA